MKRANGAASAAAVARVVHHTLVLVLLVLLADLCLAGALLVKAFDQKAGWKISCWTAGWFWGYMQTHFESDLNGAAAIRVTGDAIPEGEAAIVLTNHLSYADFYLTQHVAVKAGMLSRSRYFAKKELVWMIPLFGWAFWAMDMILVSRNWTNDSALIEKAFRSIKTNDHTLWVSLSPEGTRRTPSKLLASQAFSIQHGKPLLHHILWPRTKGFMATVKGLRGTRVEWVYDLTFLYLTPGKGRERLRVPSLAELLGCSDLRQAGYAFRIHVRRFSLADLPMDDEGLKDWCEDLWASKDKVLSDMLRSEEIDSGTL